MSLLSRKLAVAVALVGAVTFMAAGCGSDDSSGGAGELAALQKQVGGLEQQVKVLKAENLKLTARLARQSGSGSNSGSGGANGSESGGGAAPTGSARAYRSFQSVSKNIACAIDAKYARCDVEEKSFTSPPKPGDCQLDWGSAVAVEGSARGAFICHGDTVKNSAAPVLEYGDSSVIGSIQCDSSSAGIECRNTGTGHGFFLAREKYRTF
ncbi:MAG: hypothetical protein IPK93_12875 [Solirubrobacterales bacterium]|nr:hypothetical protein [Solirubrobacterales bacterium]